MYELEIEWTRQEDKVYMTFFCQADRLTEAKQKAKDFALTKDMNGAPITSIRPIAVH
jgi:hypothetical protein